MKDVTPPVEANLLVSFFDLTLFARTSQHMPPLDLIRTMDAFFELAGETVHAAGGRLVKIMGDAGLVVFPEEAVDAGVRSLLVELSRIVRDGEEDLQQLAVRNA